MKAGKLYTISLPDTTDQTEIIYSFLTMNWGRSRTVRILSADEQLNPKNNAETLKIPISITFTSEAVPTYADFFSYFAYYPDVLFGEGIDNNGNRLFIFGALEMDSTIIYLTDPIDRIEFINALHDSIEKNTIYRSERL